MKKTCLIYLLLFLFFVSCDNQKKKQELISTEIVNQILPSIIDSLKIGSWDSEKLNIAFNPIYILDTIYQRYSVDEIRDATKFYNYDLPNITFYSLGVNKLLIRSKLINDTLQVRSIGSVEDPNMDFKDSENRITLSFCDLYLNEDKNYGFLSAIEHIGYYGGGNMYTFFIINTKGKWNVERCLLTAIR